MADNTTVTAGSGGDTLRTLEDTDSVKWPVGVCAYATIVGTPDVLQVVTLTAGLPVQPMTGASWTVANGGTFAVQESGGALTALQVIDDWDESDRAKVNLIVGQAGIAAGAGAVAATVPRVTLASDDPAVAALQIIDNCISGSEAQVDVVTVPTDPFGANADAASATGSISAKLRFIASTGIPITGTVTVGSHAVTNAGTFAVQVDGTALTRLTDIETNTDSGAIVGNGAAATAQRVTLANDSTGIVALTTSTASIGKLAANSGVDIGDVDVTSVPTDPFGANADAASATGSISAKLRFIASTGIPVTGTVTVSLAAGTNTNEVVGDAAEDAALAGNPVRTGIRASRAVPTAMSADGDVVTPWGDREGRQIVRENSGTATETQVSDTATSATLLAANTQRIGCSIQNDSSAVLYIKCGTTASATDYTARLVQYSYWEAPYGYTGRIDGIWASDPGDGAARITEYT